MYNRCPLIKIVNRICKNLWGWSPPDPTVPTALVPIVRGRSTRSVHFQPIHLKLLDSVCLSSVITLIFLLNMHSSLLSVFSLNATSTYDSYLPWIFGKFAMIWGHFQNISTSRFRGRWCRRGQTTSKSKTMKILNENLLKLDEIQNLASATSKMTSWPLWPRKRLSGFFQKIHL